MSVKQQKQATLTEVAIVIVSNMVNCPYARHHATKDTRRGDMKVYIFSSLALDGAEWSASHSSHFTLTKRAPSTSGGAFMSIMRAP
jgi:hypothetical protein